MKRLILTLIFALLLPVAAAQAQISIEKEWFGEYKATSKEIKDPKSPTGVYFELTGWTLLRQTDVIKLRDNLQFGVSYIVRGARGTTEVENVFFLPDDDGRASTNRTPEFLQKQYIAEGKKGLISWVIPEGGDYSKMKLGTYIFQVRHQNRVMIEQRFEVSR